LFFTAADDVGNLFATKTPLAHKVPGAPPALNFNCNSKCSLNLNCYTVLIVILPHARNLPGLDQMQAAHCLFPQTKYFLTHVGGPTKTTLQKKRHVNGLYWSVQYVLVQQPCMFIKDLNTKSF